MPRLSEPDVLVVRIPKVGSSYTAIRWCSLSGHAVQVVRPTQATDGSTSSTEQQYRRDRLAAGATRHCRVPSASGCLDAHAAEGATLAAGLAVAVRVRSGMSVTISPSTRTPAAATMRSASVRSLRGRRSAPSRPCGRAANRAKSSAVRLLTSAKPWARATRNASTRSPHGIVDGRSTPARARPGRDHRAR